MIRIEEIETIKCPGISSFTVQIGYDPALFKRLLSIPNAIYHKKLKKFEFPIASLSQLIDLLIEQSDITMSFLPSKVNKNHRKPRLKYKTTPYQYQLDGIEFGLNHDNFLLLDTPGLGKTVQSLLLAEELHALGEVEHCLIVCGINILKTNWEKEIQKHSRLSSFLVGKKISKYGNVSFQGVQYRVEQLKQKIEDFFVIINIESLRYDEIIDAINNGPNKFDMIVFDECHTCFDYNTIIATNMGDIKIGDLVEKNIDCCVLSKNKSGEYEYKEIVNRHKKLSTNNLMLQFDNGDILDCTTDHLIYTLNRGWVEAKDLTPEDIVDNVL